MRVISNAFFSQAEVTQVDRWEYGPLELHLISEPQDSGRAEFGGRISEWNRHQCAGFLRSADVLGWLESIGLGGGENPNLIIAPSNHGYSDLLGMLGGLLPDAVLRTAEIERPTANFWLWPIYEEICFRSRERCEMYGLEELNRLTDSHLQRLGSIIPQEFEKWIWTKLVQRKRFNIQNFSFKSSLRLLTGDIRFWMHRLYRVAIDLYESLPPTKHKEKSWRSLRDLNRQMSDYVPEKDRSNFELMRPRMGGTLWEPNDPDDRERITCKLIEGDTTAASLDPVIEVLLGSAVHEDFSERYSWIKEDFERAFYSKRSKIKVKFVESVDDCPVHDGLDTPGYEDMLFRDLMTFFDQRDQSIIVALRQGKTQLQIAEQLGHSGHASISRRIKLIEKRVRQCLRS